MDKGGRYKPGRVATARTLPNGGYRLPGFAVHAAIMEVGGRSRGARAAAHWWPIFGCAFNQSELQAKCLLHSLVMLEMSKNRQNWAVWVGSLLALGAVLCNLVFFVNLPGQRAIAWLSMLLSVVALIFLGLGVKRAFEQPPVYRGKILSSMLSFVSLLLVGLCKCATARAESS